MAGPKGFKIADGYVEVHADYDRSELQRAAQEAADDHDKAFNKERLSNAKSSETRDTNRKIGGLANADFVRGVQEQVRRQKETPFISVDNVRRDASKLGKVHVAEFHRAVEEGYFREEGRVLQIGRRFAQHIHNGFKREVDQSLGKYRTMGRRITDAMFGKDNAAKAGANFFKAFIEAVTFGQADLSRPQITGTLTKWGARLGSMLGVALASALVVQIGNAVTALLPVALGGALLAIPIADLIFRNVSLEKGKLTFLKTEIGNALKGFIRGAQHLADTLGKMFGPTMLAGLESATRLFEAIEGPLARAVHAIDGGALAMWNGLLGAVVSFGKAMGPAMKGINAGLKQWGIELPKIGKAIGEAFSSILKNPALVRTAVMGLSNLIQGLVKVAAGMVVFLTYALAAWRNLWRVVDAGKNILSGMLGIPQAWAKVTAAFKPLKKAILEVWEAFKKFATATNDKQAVDRLRTLVEKIKAVWKPLKAFLAEVWKLAWDKVKEIWNTKVKPWWNNTALPWLKSKLKEGAKAAFKMLWEAAVAELKKLPGKAENELKKLVDKVKQKFKDAWQAAKDKAKQLVTDAVAKLKELPGKAASAISNLWSKMKGKFTDAVTNAKKKAKDLVDGFITKFKELPGKAASEAQKVKDKIIAKFSGAASWLINAGKNIISGLASGIRQGASAAITAAGGVASRILAAAKAKLGIKSPSTVFAEEVGKPIAQGIGVGMREQIPVEFDSMRGLMPAMAGAGRGTAAAARSYSSTYSPNVNVHVSEGLNPVNAAARRALIKEIFLELEQYRKDYVR